MQLTELCAVADRAAEGFARQALARHEAGFMTAAEIEHERNAALCDAETFADWLCSECIGQQAYDGGRRDYDAHHDADALKIDYDNARIMGAPELLALALGMTPNPEARIAAMDELARRYLEHLHQQERRSLDAGRAALKAFGFPEVRS